MAIKHKMIEPFEERLVRKGVISYGLSSYGYDMRLADEFLIFTNVWGAIVDPKAFDERAFVRHKGDFCIIPPNSFVLGRSVEYFRIPREVICIVVGKSSYARCGIVVNVTPLEPCYDKETELLTLEGWKRFDELTGKELVATLNQRGELEYQKIEKVHKFRYKGKLIRIAGRSFDLAVTPAHLLLVRKRGRKHFEFIPAYEIYGRYDYELKRDAIWKGTKMDFFELPPVEINGRFSQSHALRRKILSVIGEEPMATRDIYKACGVNVSQRRFLWTLDKLARQGYLQKEHQRTLINGHSIKVAIWKKTKRCEESPLLDTVMRPSLKIPMDDWLRFFGFWLAEGSCYRRNGEYVVKLACFNGKVKKKVRKWLKRLPFHFIETDTGFAILDKQLYSYLVQFGHASQKFIPSEIKSLPPKQLKILLDAFLLGDGNKQTLTLTTSSKRLADDLQEVILKCGWASIVRRIPKEAVKPRVLQGHVIRQKHDIFKVRIAKRHLTPKLTKRNFSEIDYDDFVYDVTVPNHTLYVRRNGKTCWSSNCWEGHVTIEISNTTPLPAKIYANEGIAQVIFLSADEVCEVSYADRKGKYQGQKGIVPPKVE
jgi:deoxycytidine triphosphate deaminase